MHILAIYILTLIFSMFLALGLGFTDPVGTYDEDGNNVEGVE